MTRVLVTRARNEAERTAEKLRRLGFTPLISPVIEIVATGATIPRETFDAGLATSARAIRHAGEGLDGISSLPFYVVGARTAQAAEQRGLCVTAQAPDVEGLIAMLRESPLPTLSSPTRKEEPARPDRSTRETPIASAPSPAERGRDWEAVSPFRFLYLAGRDRKDKLERCLYESGHRITTVETYEARAARSLSDEALAALSRGEITAVLHYSARSAAIFLELASDLPPSGGASVTHLALSEDIARVLRDADCVDVRVARAPDEEQLLRALREL